MDKPFSTVRYLTHEEVGASQLEQMRKHIDNMGNAYFKCRKDVTIGRRTHFIIEYGKCNKFLRQFIKD